LPASIEADVLPGHVFHGHVASLAPATGAQFSVLPTGNFPAPAFLRSSPINQLIPL
jgi:multidrug resistance efflux pump